MPRVYIPAPLQEMCGGTKSIDLQAATLDEIIASLDERWPGVRGRLCRGNELAAGLQISIDGAFSSRGLRAKVAEATEIHFLPALGGG